jgi:hypothetical protein
MAKPLRATINLVMALPAPEDEAHILQFLKQPVVPDAAGIDVPRRAAQHARESRNETPRKIVVRQLRAW